MPGGICRDRAEAEVHIFRFYELLRGREHVGQRLATEMEDVCREMLQQGLHLIHVVPVASSEALRGGWTEGAWLYFASR